MRKDPVQLLVVVRSDLFADVKVGDEVGQPPRKVVLISQHIQSKFLIRSLENSKFVKKFKIYTWRV